MSSSPDNLDGVPRKQPCEDTRVVVYLVKRSSYTLTIAVPQLSTTRLSWEQAGFQAQFKSQGQLWSCKLGPPELEMLYEDLQMLIEYLRAGHG